MIITVFDVIKNFIIDLLSSSQWKNILILFSGIITGFVLASAIYAVMIVVSIKKDKKDKKNQIVEVDDEKINRLITMAKNEFKEDCSSLNINDKFVEVGHISLRLVEDIAKTYYPNSKHPLYELSIEELILLNSYITERIDSIFNKRILKSMRGVRVSSIFSFFDMKKKLDESKAKKALTKFKVVDTVNLSRKVLNAFNPAFWVKKLINGITIPAATNKIALTIIEIVAEETNKVYSKSVFGFEKGIDKSDSENIEELFEMLEKEN